MNFKKIFLLLNVISCMSTITAMEELLKALEASTTAYQRYTGAIWLNRPNEVKDLIALGIDPNDRNKYGDTALMEAASKNNLEIVKLLLAGGAKPDLKNRNEESALSNAILFSNNPEIVKQLLDAGANPNIKDIRSATPLMRSMGNLKIMEYLLAAGAEVNAKAKDGSTALIEATKAGAIEAVKRLLLAGADVNIRDNYGKGKTAYDYSIQFNRTEISKLLGRPSGGAQQQEQASTVSKKGLRPTIDVNVYEKVTGKKSTSLTPREILGVSADANQDEIKKAYRQKISFWHPDRNKDKDAAQAAQLINWANEQLQ